MSGQNPEKRLGPAVAEEVRVLLARRRISVVQLAKLMGVSQPYLSRRINGTVAFDMDDLERIADTLNIDFADLLPKRAATTPGGTPIRDFTPVTRLATPAPASPPRRTGHRPSGHPNDQRRPVGVRRPGHTMSSTLAA